MKMSPVIVLSRTGYHTGSLMVAKTIIAQLNVSLFWELDVASVGGLAAVRGDAQVLPLALAAGCACRDTSADPLRLQTRSANGSAGGTPSQVTRAQLEQACLRREPCAATGWVQQPGPIGTLLHGALQHTFGSNLATVFLHRTNRVKHAVSLLKWQSRLEQRYTSMRNHKQEEHSGSTRRRHGDKEVMPRLHIAPRLVVCFAVFNAVGARVARNHNATVSFEAMQADATGAMARIATALRLPHAAPGRTSGLVKVMPDDLRDTLANFAEVSEALQPWPCLAEMLNAPTPVEFAPCAELLSSSLRARLRKTQCPLHLRAMLANVTNETGWPVAHIVPDPATDHLPAAKRASGCVPHASSDDITCD